MCSMNDVGEAMRANINFLVRRCMEMETLMWGKYFISTFLISTLTIMIMRMCELCVGAHTYYACVPLVM